MSYRYDGIKAETIMLMMENRFRNSKEFYDEHKQQLKDGFTVPIRQVVAALSDTLLDIDDQLMLIPEKTVARIRRDTRFSKEKSLYRDNLWAMFMRDKHELPYHPCMWFEVSPRSYSGGVGVYYAPPALMRIFREHISKDTAEFLRAALTLEAAGCAAHAQQYAKKKEGCPDPRIEPFYNAKSLYFIFEFNTVKDLENSDFIEKIRGIYAQMKPMYDFLLRVSREYGESLIPG